MDTTPTAGSGNGEGGTNGAGAPSFGASGATGASGDTAEPSVGGGPPEQPCGAGGGAPSIPQVEETVSARYRWSECGRIAAGGRAVDALYAADGSILSLEEKRGVRVYVPGSASDTLLDVEVEWESRMALADGGARLLVWDPDRARVFETAEHEPIGAASGRLAEVLAIDTATPGCDGSASLSSDGGTLAAQGDEKLCAWDVDQGALLSTISLGPRQTSWPAVAATSGDGSELRVFRDGVLSAYTLSGQLVRQVELASRWPASVDAGIDARAAFSADAESLLILAGPLTALTAELIALDATSGTARWRQKLTQNSGNDLALTPSGFAVVAGDNIYRIDDGAKVAAAPRGYGGAARDLDDAGMKMLDAPGQARVWDLAEQRPERIYGALSSPLVSIDVSRDGRFLASHDGAVGTVWQLASQFASSIPLFNGAAEGAALVAIAPDGESMLLSGDVVASFGRDGAGKHIGSAPPDAVVGLCLNTGWEYAPNGCLVAGMRYSREIMVYDASGVSHVATRATQACGSVAFSPDSSRLMTAKLELFDTSDWSLLWSKAPTDQAAGPLGSTADIDYSPDGVEVTITECEDGRGGCKSSRFDARSGAPLGHLPQLTAPRTRYSPEGHWLVSGRTLQHLPTGSVVEYGQSVAVAAFTPDGDIIAGDDEGSLVRYCRSRD